MKPSKIIFPSRQSSLSQLNRILKGKKYSDARYYILTDENTSQHCLPLLISKVEALQESEFLEIESGESNKTIDIASQLWQALLEMGVDSNSIIVNLGGGMVSDMGGFVAAAYHRGIRYINIPTTLLAMTDAAIGGKTAVNIGEVKNQIGFFHSAEIVCIEPDFLTSLPDREYTAGIFEMMKTLMVGDPELYNLFCTKLLNGEALPMDMVKAAAQIKAAVVKADPYDKGIRKMLNWGHTLGHAIESYSLAHDQQPLLHGEAIALGMIGEAYLSTKKLNLDNEEYNRIKSIVSKIINVPQYALNTLPELINYIKADKKKNGNTIYCTLLNQIGEPVIDVAVSENEICDALMNLR